jgi:fructose-1-phosphate kinase PfkB-like protein
MVAGMAVTVARGDDVLTALKLATVAGAAAATAVGTGQGAAADVAGLVGPVEIEVLK